MSAEIIPTKTYVKAFAALMVLLVVTVFANLLNLGPFNVAVAMLISLAKLALIVLFFMEVRYSPPMVWLFAAAGVIWLALMIIMAMSDYATRGWNRPDWRSENDGVNRVEFNTPH